MKQSVLMLSVLQEEDFLYFLKMVGVSIGLTFRERILQCWIAFKKIFFEPVSQSLCCEPQWFATAAGLHSPKAVNWHQELPGAEKRS